MSSPLIGYGLVLSVRPFAEGGALVTLFCRQRGLVKGLVKRGASKLRLLPLDEVSYGHYRRLENQLGSLMVEPCLSRAVWTLGGRHAGAVAAYVVEVLSSLLPEEHPYPAVWEAVQVLLAGTSRWAEVAGFEREVLAAIGYGLPLGDDAVPCPEGTPLAYVSPVSGRAVSVAMGKPYMGRLLKLPALWGGPAAGERDDCVAALGLTGYFLQRVAPAKRLLARGALMELLNREMQDAVVVSLDGGIHTDEQRRYG